MLTTALLYTCFDCRKKLIPRAAILKGSVKNVSRLSKALKQIVVNRSYRGRNNAKILSIFR